MGRKEGCGAREKMSVLRVVTRTSLPHFTRPAIHRRSLCARKMSAQTIIPAADVADLWQSMHELAASLGNCGHSAAVMEAISRDDPWNNLSTCEVYRVTTGQPLVIAG